MSLKGKLFFETTKNTNQYITTAQLYVHSHEFKSHPIMLFSINTEKPVFYQILAYAAMGIWNDKKYRKIITAGNHDSEEVNNYILNEINSLQDIEIYNEKGDTSSKFSINITLNKKYNIRKFCAITDVEFNNSNPILALEPLAEEIDMDIPQFHVLLQIDRTDTEITFAIFGSDYTRKFKQAIQSHGKTYSYAAITKAIIKSVRQTEDGTWVMDSVLGKDPILFYGSKFNNFADLVNESEYEDGAQILLKLVNGHLTVKGE